MSRQYKNSKFVKKQVNSLELELKKADDTLKKNKTEKPNQSLPSRISSCELNADKIYEKALELYKIGNMKDAELNLNKALSIYEIHEKSHILLMEILYYNNKNDELLNQLNSYLAKNPNSMYGLEKKALILTKEKRYPEAENLWEQLINKRPDVASIWHGAGNFWQQIGKLDRAIDYYNKALNCTDATAINLSSLFITLHYHPKYDVKEIFEVSKLWQKHPSNRKIKQYKTYQNKNKNKNKKIKIGLFSDGFRTHPVGQMITTALEEISNHEIELYFYSTNNSEDIITHKLKNIAKKWMSITHLNCEEFSEKIRADNIDILFDLCGHNAGTKLSTMLMKPVPIQVKWVGGLINTTGISTIDYLLSDHIETPESVDSLYIEKLIRMPDDYICYNPPFYTPDVKELPAKHNKHITLGCFNNPTKINEVLLKEWSGILNSLPNSRLLLKGAQFSNEIFKNDIIKILLKEGITKDRVIIEGPSNHGELLNTYNKVDIALDPWPYSGGLTTCEALFMGVPVVTLPGPTFAGRHSATHLTNVGLSQLVAEDWQQYHDIVVNLANDLDNLANIRTHLRSALLESPVCNAKRFARNFSNAMRAIWQRHCEGKAPAALNLDKAGSLQFIDEDHAVVLQLPADPITVVDNDEFRFQFQGKIITIDNGANLAVSHKLYGLQKLGAFNTLCLDPGSRVKNSQQLNNLGDFHHFPMTVLGDGSTVPLYITVDPALTSTLLAVKSTQSFFSSSPQPPDIISELPIKTLALDTLEAITTLDWLILDRLHNNQDILKNGQKKLATALVIQVGINLQPAYQQQASWTNVCQQLHDLGFRFLTTTHLGSHSHFSDREDILTHSTSELLYVDALFIPNDQRLLTMDNNSKTKLAFLLHSAYQLKDISYQLLASINTTQAENYLLGENSINTNSKQQIAKSERSATSFELPTAPAMTTNEQQLFLSYLKKVQHYFEFGSGGSTVWAVQQGLTVQGVESDPSWVKTLQDKLGQQCQVAVADIGPTGDWGYPLLTNQSDKFPRYSQAILEHEKGFDLILIDGRFRVACTMATIQHIIKHNNQDRSIIFIHDFWNRPQYRSVLDFLVFIEQVDSAGIFKVKKDIEINKVVDMWLMFSTDPN